MNFYDVESLKRERKQMKKITHPLIFLGFGVDVICTYFGCRRQDSTLKLFGFLVMVFWPIAVVFVADLVAYYRSLPKKKN